MKTRQFWRPKCLTVQTFEWKNMLKSDWQRMEYFYKMSLKRFGFFLKLILQIIISNLTILWQMKQNNAYFYLKCIKNKAK